MSTPIRNGDRERASDWGIPGTYVFDPSRSRLGCGLNKLAYSLVDPDNRDAFRKDPTGYMARYELSEPQRDAIRRADWLALIKLHGGNIYYLYKLAAAMGIGLYHMGAQMRGESYEQFLATRGAKGAR